MEARNEKERVSSCLESNESRRQEGKREVEQEMRGRGKEFPLA
jgi:hypothetical protein